MHAYKNDTQTPTLTREGVIRIKKTHLLTTVYHFQHFGFGPRTQCKIVLRKLKSRPLKHFISLKQKNFNFLEYLFLVILQHVT